MTFSIIGYGNIAWFVGSRLTAAGMKCTGVYGRAAEKREQLATQIGAITHDSIDNMNDSTAEVCLLAVADNAIAHVVSGLKLKNTVLIHTSGATDIECLSPAALHYGVFWPVYSIVKDYLPLTNNIPCAWEANDATSHEFIHQVGYSITGQLFEARFEQRKWLHLGAVISNNFINHLMAIGEHICRETGLPFAALQPIIAETFERAAIESPAKLQTGPAIRQDTSTLTGQKELLSSHPAWQKVYMAITESIQDMYGKQNY